MKSCLFGVLLFMTCLSSIWGQEISETAVAEIMNNSFALIQEKKHQEALEAFLKVGDYTKKQRTENERKVYVLSQTMAVMCYKALTKYEEGFLLSEELLKGIIDEEQRKNLQQLYVINGYYLLSSLITKERQYAKGREIIEKILPFADEAMRQRIHPKLPLTWLLEGMRYQKDQKYDQALFCLKNACEGFKKIGDTDNEIKAWSEMGSIWYFLYRTEDAINAYQQAYALAASTKNDIKMMSSLIELHKLYAQLGDSEKTITISAEMDSLSTSARDDKVRFDYYSHLGNIATDQGNYKMAERWYQKNDAYINQLEENHIGAEKSTHFSNLRDLYKRSGNLEAALNYAWMHKQEFQRIRDKSDKQYYMPYWAIADIYRLKGDSVACFQCLDTLFLSLNRLDEPREAFQLYASRARCYNTFNMYYKSLADLKKADDLLAIKYGEDDGDRITLIGMMGGIEYNLYHYDEAERIYRKFAEGTKDLFGENSREYINALGYLANAEAYAGHIEFACRDYEIAVDKMKQVTQQRLPYMTTLERESYWNSVSKLLVDMTPFALEAKEFQTKFTKTCYDNLVLLKAFLLESERSVFDLVKNNGTDEDLRDYRLVANMQAKIRGWEIMGRQYTDSILELTSRAKKIETRLSSRCRSFGDMTSFMGIGYQEIKNKLKDGEVLIDFTDFLSKSRDRMYAAYIIDNKQEYPLLKNLFAESKIDSMQVAYPDEFYKIPHSEKMYQILWKPFKNKVTEGSTIYYVPSQLLFQIALESIPTEDGTLLGEHYKFVRLSSARELMVLDGKLNIEMPSNITNAVLYGGLLYDMEDKDMAEEAKKYDVSSLLAVRGGIHRGNSIFKGLPGSKKEVEAIEKILRSHQLSVTSYTGKMGTEESFIYMSGKAPQILHMATHGFFYTPTEAQEIDYLRGYEDAMSLSGLVMSGGNAAWRGKEIPEGILGGILTAHNIAKLDLTNAELVVLSACESGRGQATSEGLYGLQRAFKKAGVKTIIMSLWNVSDVVGTEFMRLFYENLLDKDNHWDKRAAFNKAKSDIRKKYPKQPYYWACFIMLD